MRGKAVIAPVSGDVLRVVGATNVTRRGRRIPWGDHPCSFSACTFTSSSCVSMAEGPFS